MNEFLTIRHSRDDRSYIDGKNNTSLTCEGIEIAKNMSNKVLNCVDDRKIIVRHSTKKRAIETAEILCERFDKNNIDYEVKSDSNLTELYQGEFRNLDLLNHEERIQLLQSCWEEFDKYRLNNNLDYRFGDYKNAINKKKLIAGLQLIHLGRVSVISLLESVRLYFLYVVICKMDFYL